MRGRYARRGRVRGVVVKPVHFEADLVHVRTERIRRAFRHRMHLWLVDLDDLPRPSRFAEFRARDHLGSPEKSIRENLDAWLGHQGVHLRGGQVLMLTTPRALGHVFNPLSVYWCHRPDGALVCVVAEVHNTYGERHCYLLHPDSRGQAEAPKEFYVSPFLAVEGTYRMRLPLPGDRLSLAITLRRDENTTFSAVLTGRKISGGTVRAALSPHRVSALIRRHGIALWARRVPVVHRVPHSQEGVQ